MIAKISEEELRFMECWYTPRCFLESLFHDFDDFGQYNEEEFGNIRLYQLPMYSDEVMIDWETTQKYYNQNDDLPDLEDEDIFNLKKNVGDCYNLGARTYGKTLVTLKLDMINSVAHESGLKAGFFSIDTKRIKGVLEPLVMASKYHPIIKLYNLKCNFKPDIHFRSEANNWDLIGVNMTLKGRDPGHQFYQMHVEKLWGEEVSFETEKIHKKRIESTSELGAIERFAGMTNFTPHSPIGRVFNDYKNRKKIINYSRSVNPTWNEEKRKEKARQYGGEDTLEYRIYVDGEVVADGESVFKMDKVREKCFLVDKKGNPKKRIKRFEIKEEEFSNFEHKLIVERPKNAERIFINADIGESTQGYTDITIFSEVGNKYNYLYDIILYDTDRKQQEAVFRYLISKLEANVIGLDCSEALGRVIADDLEEEYGREHISRYKGQSKVKVDFEKDDNGNIIYKKGKVQYRKEYMSEWAVRRLKTLFYDGRIRIPVDYKLDVQLTAVIASRTSTRVKYACPSGIGDHLWDSFKVFSIAQWKKADFAKTKNIQENVNRDRGTGSSSWI